MKQIRTENIEVNILESGKKLSFGNNRHLIKLLTNSIQVLQKEWAIVFCNKLPSQSLLLSATLTLCGETKIKSLNHIYRNKFTKTDVLSFQIQQDLRNKLTQKSVFKMGFVELGDIYICKEVAKRQAAEFDISWQAEIIHLFIHGFLHLLGYDHEQSNAELLKMERVELAIIKGLKTNE